MSQLSAIIEKPLLNLATSCIIGKVSDVYFDENIKEALYFCIKPSESDSPALLAFSGAQSILDAVTVADDSVLLPMGEADLSSTRSGVMGLRVFTPQGADKGKISDAFLNAGGKVTKLQTEVCEFAQSAIKSIGNVIALKANAKIKSRKSTIPRPEKDYPVYVLNDTEKVLQIEKSILEGSMPVPAANKPKEPVMSDSAFNILLDGSNEPAYDEDSHTPTRIICDYDFLLGRTLGADLLTYTGELIAKKDSVVTDSTVKDARRAGKLVELTLNSVKP